MRLDPPMPNFRIRLAGVLLDACGRFFSRGSGASRLDRFLAYLQRYVRAKPQLPLDVQFDLEVGGTLCEFLCLSLNLSIYLSPLCLCFSFPLSICPPLSLSPSASRGAAAPGGWSASWRTCSM